MMGNVKLDGQRLWFAYEIYSDWYNVHLLTSAMCAPML